MSVIDLTAHRQALQDAEDEALNTSDEEIERMELFSAAADQEEAEIMALARSEGYHHLRLIK